MFRQPERDVALLWNARDKLLRHVASLSRQLQKEKQSKLEKTEQLQKQTEQLRWIYAHSLRFALANFFHVYIKRDRKRREIRKN